MQMKDFIAYGYELYFAVKNIHETKTEKNVINEYDAIWTNYNNDPVWTNYINSVIKDSLKNIDYSSVLEVGCGMGSNIRMLNDGYHRCYGLDISSVGIRKANDYKDGVTYFCCSASRIPLDKVDVVFSVHALEQMNGCIDDVVNELWRVTGKRLVLIEPFYEHQTMFGKLHNKRCDYPKDLYGKIKKVGFKVVSFNRLPQCSSSLNRSGLLICNR